ncbi:MAG: ABC transporter permease [Alphaproteobacteria bacterium]|nr:ABC transporter permease [Alphaproteobacteria bacterium]MCB9794534.1 ABC transporter permease [Alphaproteobacteria bacterium]
MLKLAARNLLRHRRRTIITALGIALGLAMMVFTNNLGEGVHADMIRVGVSQMAGHVVVQEKGYQEDREPEQLIPGASAVAATLAERFPEAVVTRRSLLMGLLSSPTGSMGVGVTAVDPGPEAEATDWEDKLIEGAWIEGDQDLILGYRLAESLDVGLGDKVVLMSQGVEDVSSRMFRVSGLLKTGVDDTDGFLAIAHVDAAAELLGVPDAAHQVALHLPDPKRTAEVTQGAREALAGVEGVEVLPWKQAVPEMWEYVRLDTNMTHVLLGMIGFILSLGVLNTVLMSVMERIKEFGVLLALGMSPRRLARMVVLEALVLGAISSALGLTIGSAITQIWVKDGMDYSAFMGVEAMDVGGVALSTTLPLVHYWSVNLVYTALAVVLVVLASLYPAFKASRLRPVDAMRHV